MIDAGYNYDRLKEKMEWLGIKSRRTFAKFLDGLTKFNQEYEVVEK